MKTIQNDLLTVDIDAADLTVTVTDRRSGRAWCMARDGAGDIGIQGHCGPLQRFMFRDAHERQWTRTGPQSLRVTVTGWPYTANVWSPLGLGFTVDFSLDGDTLSVSTAPWRNEHYEASIVDSFYPRGFLFPNQSRGDLVVPLSQGCLLDKDADLKLDLVLPGYVGFGFIMPWWGQLCADGDGLIALTETPDDLAFRIRSDGGRCGATVEPCWLASLGGFKYQRMMRYRFLVGSSVMDMARIYRGHAAGQGQVLTLREKARQRPMVDKLIGGPHMHLWFMSTFTRGGRSPKVRFMRFEEGLRRYRELCRRAGVGRQGIAHIDGWGRDGYDFNHPDVTPPDTRLGSWQGLAKLRDGLRELGHAVLLHDNYVDYYKHTQAFAHDDGVRNLDGLKHESTEWLGGPQQWLCSTQARKYMEHNEDELRAHGCAVDGFYIDCWSIGHLRECYDPKHLATRSDTRHAWSDALASYLNRGLVLGSESGNDWVIPFIDHCHTVMPEAIPHSLVGKVARFGRAIPLFNMVWHDCLVCPAWVHQDPRQGDVVKEGMIVPEVRDIRLWGLLWGGPPAFRAEATMLWNDATEDDFARDAAFIASLRPMWQFHADVGYEPISDWRMLDDAGNVQRTVFGNGAWVEVDFTTGGYRLHHGGETIEGRFDRNG